MNAILNKLSDIEQYASAIADDANARKKAIALEMERKTAAFDARLDAETAEKLNALRKQTDGELQAKLSILKQEAEESLRQMKANYEANHQTYARQLFSAMTER